MHICYPYLEIEHNQENPNVKICYYFIDVDILYPVIFYVVTDCFKCVYGRVIRP